MWIIIISSIWFICAGFSSYIANQKNRSSFNWFLLGLLFGLFALITIASIPSLKNTNLYNHYSGGGGLKYWKCKKCGQINGFAIRICSKCGNEY